jgi:thiol-disulfide isomerase/thioredoxin
LKSSNSPHNQPLQCASLFAAVLLLAAAMLALPGCSNETERGREPEQPASTPSKAAASKRLPELRLVAVDDLTKTVGLEDLAGRVVLVDFWGTWCPPCREELPHLVAIGKKYSGRTDFQLLAITCAQQFPEDIAALRQQTLAFLNQTKLDLAAYLDPNAATRRAFLTVSPMKGYPTTFLMDRQGVVRKVWPGYLPQYPEEMDQQIQRLLEEKAG